MKNTLKRIAQVSIIGLSLTLGISAHAQNILSFEQNGLEPLANGFHYEGWLIIDGAPVTTGKFNVNVDGDIVDLDNRVIGSSAFIVPDNSEDASLVVLTIEPAGDVDAIPAETKYLSGAIENGVAHLDIATGPALGSDFSEASGSYILATPTNGNETDEHSGVWFLDLSSGMPSVGLNLPELPSGWEYEGWAVIDGQPISTGRFTDVAAADDFSGFSGDQGGPPFPGEDFLVNAPEGLNFPVDLSGAPIVISVEPSPDDSAAPFALKPLVGVSPEDAQDHFTYSFDNNSAGAATIVATLN